MTKPTVVLVHGARHGPCWEAVRTVATERGMRSVAVSLPSCAEDVGALGSPADDVVAVRAAVDDARGPVVLVGHSLGGVAVSDAAAGRSAVRHLVYLAAFMLEEGQSTAEVVGPGAAGDWVLSPDGRSVSAADPVSLFYSDFPAEKAAAAVARLRPQNPASGVHPLGAAAWREIPSTYVVCTRDQAIPPSLQEAWAPRARCVERLDCDHSPFLSHRERVVSILEDAVTAALEPSD
jgi:pimeloyl-ACP methyl ester carboxylesterase